MSVWEPRRILRQSTARQPSSLSYRDISLHCGATRCNLTFPYFQTAIQWENRDRTAPAHIQVIKICLFRKLDFNLFERSCDYR